MNESSKTSAISKRILLLSVFIIPAVMCFAFYIFMIRKPFLENPSGVFIKLNYYGPKKFASNGKDTIYCTVPDFNFVNQEGKTITQNDYSNKNYVVNFFSTDCQTICPKMSAQLFRVQKKLGYIKSFSILSHTVNPEKDSSAVLKQYAITVHAEPNNWNFVTGDRKALRDIECNGYFITDKTVEEKNDSLNHSTTFLLIDKNRHIRGIYEASSTTEVDRLIDEAKVLDAEFRKNK